MSTAFHHSPDRAALRAGLNDLNDALRVKSSEIMTYHLDGWVVREYPAQRIVKLAPVGEFRSRDFPLEA